MVVRWIGQLQLGCVMTVCGAGGVGGRGRVPGWDVLAEYPALIG